MKNLVKRFKQMTNIKKGIIINFLLLSFLLVVT